MNRIPFARRRTAARLAGLCLAVIANATLGAAPLALAQQGGVIVIGNDRGGYVGQRADEIRRIVANGQRVEIRGNICYSSCTMYLGAGNVCVSPRTSFGFHGPSDHGRPLPADRFDHWSRVMARHYREPLRSWFLQDARFIRNDVARLSGAQLIRMGYPRC